MGRRLLFYRGITDKNEADKFLNPDYDKHLHNPFLMMGMEKAVERIHKAVCNNERIAIWSDYDADGIPGAVVLHDFFKKTGFANFENYIPDRHNEGFGLNAQGINELSERGTKLIITVDCGIADAKEISLATALGIETVITDHHLPNGEIPEAYAIVNPNQNGCTYPDKNLCGAGVTFKLIQALCLRARSGLKIGAAISPGWEKWLLDMVGLATLSDMVSLTGENRVLAHYGLKVLRKTPRTGLRELLARLKIKQKNLTEDDIGFMITPRINAASRMGKPMDAFKLLSTSDDLEAGMYADHLNKINDERKGHVAAIVKEVKKIISERLVLTERKVIVIGNPAWRPGLLGLVANSLADIHSRPVFLWGRESGEKIKGSCRSGGDVNVVELMEEAGHAFAEFGGHHHSGGFTISPENVHTLPDTLERAYDKIRKKTTEEEPTWIDARISLDDVDEETVSLVEKLSPFGVGNPKPLFLLENALIDSIRWFGKGSDHLELSLPKPAGGKVKAVSFFAKKNAGNESTSSPRWKEIFGTVLPRYDLGSLT